MLFSSSKQQSHRSHSISKELLQQAGEVKNNLLPNTTFFAHANLNISLSLDAGSNPIRGGSITIDGFKIVIPAHTLVTLPSILVAWPELFVGGVADLPSGGPTWQAHVCSHSFAYKLLREGSELMAFLIGDRQHNLHRRSPNKCSGSSLHLPKLRPVNTRSYHNN